MKCRDCENLGWSYDEGERIYWCYVKRVYCPDLDIERSCSYFSLKKLDIFTTLSTIQAENENLRAELEQVTAERDAAVRQVALISQPNEPLPPEVLKKMVQEAGKPVVVWTVNIEDDGSLDLDSGEWEMFDGVDFSAPNTLDDLSHYGQRGYFVAYRRPPEGENHHG